MIYEIITNNEKETIELGKTLGDYLLPNMVITLEGDLGAGKTTLTKGIAKALEISDIIKSPTFTIINEYDGKIPLYHMDFYRIVDDFYLEELKEYFNSGGISIIEWGSFIKEFLPNEYLMITIERLDENKRKIKLEPKGEAYIKICEEIK
ncbi:MAG TPA: tRNA (adenosine(37)-N6)-threonylcarbamoyltransferase complex ATPase subunit type 1 TsaE [Tenericutes bacterium]|jgi:tRNA threonylcarbamoyladenosine biosynthesis protein TsaE|nr:tRNA (adenosine(37)-N6)-threonylcarbamoyltransferase complex ATPase subunit type 1 TsaE [Mycoplasmatota bacterium]